MFSSQPEPAARAQGGSLWHHLTWFGIYLFVVSLLTPQLRFWSGDGFMLFGAGRYGAAIGALCLAIGLLAAKPRWKIQSPSAIALGFALFLFLFSNWLTVPYSFLQGPAIRGEILLGAGVSIALFHFRFTLAKRFWMTTLGLGILLPFLVLFSHASGRLLFSDDNATFLYRLWQLKESFPRIPFYFPLWNGGIDARDFFATGSLNIYLLFAPLIHLFSPLEIYNLIVGLVLFLILPLSIWIATRTLEGDRASACAAALLAITNSIVWYRWALKYGTLGFTISAALAPLAVALLIRAVRDHRNFTVPQCLLSIAVFTLMLMWSASALVFIPLLFFAALAVRQLLNEKRFILSLAALLALNVPWMVMFWSVSNVGNFLTGAKASSHSAAPLIEESDSVQNQLEEEIDLQRPQTDSATFSSQAGAAETRVRKLHDQAGIAATLKILREHATGANPLLILLAIPGFLLVRSGYRRPLMITCGWLLILGAGIAPLKPQLELDRMVVICGLIATIPSGLALARLFADLGQSTYFRDRAVAALLGGILFAAFIALFGVLNNRSVEQYALATPEVQGLADAIEKYSGPGRTLFSGFVLHELCGGHLAPLAMMTKKPLVASTFVHNLWWYKQIVPKQFLARGEEGIEEFFDLYNATSVIAYERKWLRYLRNSSRYKEVWSGETFTMFTRQVSNASYFLVGNGKVIEQSANGVEFTLAQPDAVMKFSYIPYLEIVDAKSNIPLPDCELSGEQMDRDLTLLNIRNCPTNTSLRLQAVSPWRRLMMELAP